MTQWVKEETFPPADSKLLAAWTVANYIVSGSFPGSSPLFILHNAEEQPNAIYVHFLVEEKTYVVKVVVYGARDLWRALGTVARFVDSPDSSQNRLLEF